jgi:hypothetical protein
MDEARRIVIEHDVQKLLTRFFRCLDARDYDKLLALFTDDAVWTRQGTDLTRDTMPAALAKRPAAMTIRHVLSNFAVDANETDRATCSFMLVVYRHEAGTPSAGPLPLAGPEQLTDGSAELELTQTGLRISRLTLPSPVFRRTT